MTDLRIDRRRLPHWRLDDATYFVTWRLARGVGDLDGVERDLVLAAVRHRVRYTLLACVVMNDHVHALVQPMKPMALEDVVRSWKSFTANRLQKGGRAGRVWQPEYFDHIVRNERELEAYATYIATNPFRRWPGIDAYPWLWIAEPAPD